VELVVEIGERDEHGIQRSSLPMAQRARSGWTSTRFGTATASWTCILRRTAGISPAASSSAIRKTDGSGSPTTDECDS
jgi:hypothetical protein